MSCTRRSLSSPASPPPNGSSSATATAPHELRMPPRWSPHKPHDRQPTCPRNRLFRGVSVIATSGVSEGSLVPRAGLQVDERLVRFVEEEAVAGLDVDLERFWSGLADLVGRLGPRNRELLKRRADLQSQIDDWFKAGGGTHDQQQAFLEEIGYLNSPATVSAVTTTVRDPELTEAAAPQLVVPLDNARYALNAANARWGSLYDALYGTDALGDPPPAGAYDPARGAKVISLVRGWLDEFVPLDGASHSDVTRYAIEGGALVVTVDDDQRASLADPAQLVGYEGRAIEPSAVWLRHHGLHLAIHIDPADPVGSADLAGVRDVELEAATTVIMDAEDSVTAVDADDKVGVYRNWLGLMRGDLTVEIAEGAATFTRRLRPERAITTPDERPLLLRGTALMLMRNVGLLMTTSAIQTADGSDIPEGILDAVMTTLIALHDRQRPTHLRNSQDGSVYIVKPKLHGPDEVRFTVDLFAAVESLLDLPPATIKLGLMDEERRTTLNLGHCIAAAGDRIVFINTGFLDRTGDEIHTCMQAGPMVRKSAMKTQPWLLAYEDTNVDVGLASKLHERGQIGKGMWAAPDQMHAMLQEKVAHPRAGANCAWVPSPTAATLHAIHYHQIDVKSVQSTLAGRPRSALGQLLTVPTDTSRTWTDTERQEELENNLQGILGYVARWVGQGVGCSKVPDIHGVGLMEDRATCRISAQHVANWLLHGIVSPDEVDQALRRMARTVDEQNIANDGYVPLLGNGESLGFQAARDLVYLGTQQPSGYTEPILHAYRRQQKAHHSRDHGPVSQ